MKKAFKGRITMIVGGLALVALVVYAFLPKPIAVDIAPVTRGAMRLTIDEDGRTRVKERYVVSAPLSGRLQRITLKAGDEVRAGNSLIATIEPVDPMLLDERTRAQAEARVKAADSARAQAAAILERAKAAHTLAKTELERVRQLVAEKIATQRELDNAIAIERAAAEELKAAQFAAQIAEFELEQAKAVLMTARPRSTQESENAKFEIHSPVNGRVLRVLQESATVVQPGTPLVAVGDPTDLEVEVDVLSADAVKIPANAKVILEHWGGERPLTGRVRRVEPAAFTKISALGVEEQRVWVIIDLTDPPEMRANLGDGYRLEARVVIWENDNVLKVPSGALFRAGKSWAVFVAKGRKAALRQITIGRNNGLEAEVLAGLSEGDRVIVHPSDKIRDGVSIAPR
jgi:HlyD family secretion protein